MKTALCLFGLVGGKTGKNGKGGNIDPRIAYEYYEKHILSKNNIDVYLHTWSVDQKEKLIELYNPKKYIFESQIIFSENAYSHRAHSRWHSTQKSINLVEGDYDMIMLSRFDVGFFTDIDFSEYDPKYFYASHWNDLGKRNNQSPGLLDLWFFGGTEIMQKFGQLYDNINDYIISQHGAAEQHILTITNKIKYVMYLGEDFEMMRRSVLKSKMIYKKRIKNTKPIRRNIHIINRRKIKFNHTIKVEEDRKLYHQQKEKKKVISFSLYGNDPKYIKGAVINAKLQEEIYPDWICRFYIHQNTVPNDIVDELKHLGCELIFKQDNFGLKQACDGRFWRYEILTDKTVDRFIVRDTDSRLSMREKVCVDKWIESGKSFHIIRDHPHHRARIMGGMWGATKAIRIDYQEQFNKFRILNKNGKNQVFLAQMIYPVIKDDVYIHDDRHFFKDEKVFRIPHVKVGNEFIGEIIYV